jgi:hypothetical protein
MMDEKIVEAVARAIWQEQGVPPYAFETLNPVKQAQLLLVARAAIVAHTGSCGGGVCDCKTASR